MEPPLRDIALELYRLGMIRFGEFTLTSGTKSNYYIDLRILPSYPELFRRVAELCVEAVRGVGYEVIVGVATGGVPLAAYMAFLELKPLAYVRPRRKEHGRMRLVEGLVEGRRCLIVDDVATTGGSLETAISAVRAEGGIPVHAFVVVDRGQGAEERIRRLGVGFSSLIKASELLAALEASGVKVWVERGSA